MRFRLALFTVIAGLSAACSPAEEHVGVPAPEPTSVELHSGDCDELRQHVVRSVADALVHARYGGVEIDDKIGGKNDESDGEEAPEDRDLQSEPPRIEVEDLLKIVDDTAYLLSDTRLTIVRIDEGGVPHLQAAFDLAGASRAIGLFVHEGKAVVLQTIASDDEAAFAGTRIMVLDVEDVESIAVLAQYDIEGEFELARRVGDDVHLVTTSAWRIDRKIWEIAYSEQPHLPAREPNADEERQQQLRDSARAEIETTLATELPSIDELMPRVVADGDARALHSCDGAMFNGRPSVHLTSLIRLGADLSLAARGILGSEFGGEVHDDTLYASFSNRWGQDAGSSHLHAFDLKHDYLATAEFAGVVIDEHSVGASAGAVHIVASEHDGARLNTATFDGEAFTELTATLLTNDELVVANRVTSNAAYVATAADDEERIFALGFDASTPTGPFEIGGIPSMIHTVDEDRILVVAQQNNTDGEQVGVQVEMFDADAEPLAATSVATGDFAAWSEAMWEPRSLIYGDGLVAFPVNIEGWDEADGANFSGVLVYEANDEIVRRGAIDHSDLRTTHWCRQNDEPDDCEAPQSNPWWTHVRRSAFVRDRILTVSDVGLKVHDVETLDELGALVFD